MGEVVKEREQERKKYTHKLSRTYAAAKASRLNSDWETIPTSGNYELRTSLRILRARARQQSRDNGIFKKFLSMARRNVVGKGIQLQCRAAFLNGSLNTKLNKQVEDLFWEWSFKENCTASQKMSFTDAQNLVVTALARDGEVLIQKIAADNPFGFALKFIDVSYLDETFNQQLTNGRRVVMSVEIDANDRPTAYYLTTPTGDSYLPEPRKTRVRVPAEEMYHFYLFSEDEAQVRGVSWFHAALRDARDLDGYKVGVISSARAAAYSFGMVVPPENMEESFSDDEEDSRPALELKLEPLSIQELPPGYEFKQFDPKQPTQNHHEFYKSILHDVASGLDVNYFSLAGDLSDVNYSTARVGLLDERDFWKGIQDFVIEHFCRPVFADWSRAALLSGKLEIAPGDFAKIQNPMWRPRGWSWVDPQKEINAQIMALENNVTTLTDVLAEQGKDLTEHFETIKTERDLAKRYGIELKYGSQNKPAAEPPPDEARDFPVQYTNGKDLELEN